MNLRVPSQQQHKTKQIYPHITGFTPHTADALLRNSAWYLAAAKGDACCPLMRCPTPCPCSPILVLPTAGRPQPNNNRVQQAKNISWQHSQPSQASATQSFSTGCMSCIALNPVSGSSTQKHHLQITTSQLIFLSLLVDATQHARRGTGTLKTTHAKHRHYDKQCMRREPQETAAGHTA